jgi:gamma-glutamyltranspeptidase / glutathione hydrolase
MSGPSPRIPAGLLFLLPVLLGGCASTGALGPVMESPGELGWDQRPPDAGRQVVAVAAAVTSANSLASDVAITVLRAGGNAIDAAVAASFAIGVVEPHMSGLGGSGSMLIWIDGKAEYLDFYAMQYAAAFHEPASADTLPVDMRIVGVPGQVAGLLEAHDRFGRLDREKVMAPAIRLAEDGFPVGQTLARYILADSAKLHRFPDAHAQMWPDGRPLRPGDVLRNPVLAATLARVAEDGRRGFYDGPVAAAVTGAMSAGGHPVTAAVFRDFKPQWKRPLCAEYRGHVVLAAPPPQTGAQIIQALKLLEAHDLPAAGLPTRSPRAFDLFASAIRVAMADNQGNTDPRWGAVPVRGRISDDFARERGSLVGIGAAAVIEKGDAAAFGAASGAEGCTAYRPWGDVLRVENDPDHRPVVDPSTRHEPGDRVDAAGGETTHISVVDQEGNAVSLTQTNSNMFGIGAWVEGFFLNDSGYRFGPDDLALASHASWRTRRSTISPTVVLENGRVKVVTGAPGAGRIPTAIVQTLAYVLDYGMDPLDAVRMPRLHPAPDHTGVLLEHGFTPDVLRDVRSMGYDPRADISGQARIYMIVRVGDRWIAIADPRHDGEPRGY